MTAPRPAWPQDIAVLLGDPRLPDRTKHGGGWTEEDFLANRLMREGLAQAAVRRGAGVRFRFLDRHAALLDDLANDPPDFVLNFCDTGYGNRADRELHIAAYLDLLGIPYSGAGPQAMVLCFDKAVVRQAAQTIGVPVPGELFAEDAAALPVADIAFPALLKPCRADGSTGITRDAVVADAAAAHRRLAVLACDFAGEPILAQEFLAGAEYGIGLIGNPATGLRALTALQVDYSRLPADLPPILGFESKTDPASPYWTKIRYRAADLPPAATGELAAHAGRLFRRLGLRDYARFDFRADAAGRIKLLEVNPNPAWCYDGKLALMAGFGGIDYPDLLGLIVDAALLRSAPAAPATDPGARPG